MKTKSKKTVSTFDREMKKPRFKKSFNKSYKAFLLSELLVAIMENDEKSVRELAKQVGLSPTVVQKIRSGKQNDIKLSNFISISHACGYQVTLEKGKERIPLDMMIGVGI